MGIWAARATPWLGIEFRQGSEGTSLHIAAVDDAGPAAGLALAGRQLLAVAAPGNAPLPLDQAHFSTDPDNWDRWSQAAAARDALDSVHALLRSAPEVELHLDGEHRVRIRPQQHTPLRTFAWEFWLKLAIALASFLCAAGVFAFRPERAANRYFALAGAMVMTQAILSNVVDTPRIGMSGVLLERAISLLHLCEFALIGFVAALASVYPLRLAHGRRVRTALVTLVPLAAWLDVLRLGDGPGTLYRIMLGGGLAVITALLFAQWRLQRRVPQPVRRNGFVVLLLCLLALDTVFYLFQPLPPDVGWVGRGSCTVGLNLGYVALGVVIYRGGLLDVDRWMVGAWLTFLAGVCLLAVDAAVVLALGHSDSTLVALLIVAALAWVYFPLRQSAWHWLARRRPMRDLREISPLLLGRLLAPGAAQDPRAAWRQLLGELFSPLHMAEAAGDAEQPSLVRGGLEMKVPAACGSVALVLRHADRGNRLFTGDDLRLVRHLAALSDRVHRFRSALDHGALVERERIAQDLHDEVIPPLLSLIYRAEDLELSTQARTVMHELRGILRDLDGHRAADTMAKPP